MNTFKKHHKKIYGVLMGFIYLLVPIIFFVFVTSRTSIFFGLRTFTVLTGSMVPKIPVASIVLTAPEASYHVGEIITFNRGSITITHRIVGIKNNKFQTKGDANNVADPQLIEAKDIIGKDYFILPYIGRFTEFIKTIPGFSIFIVIPIIIFIGFELVNIKREIEKQTEIRVRKQYEHPQI